MSGTIFIDEKTEYLQFSFFPEKKTAFIANSLAYQSLNRGYNYSWQAESSDSEAMLHAAECLKQEKPVFMRLHIQDSGVAGYESLETEKNVPWKNNIWANNSPYLNTISKADSLLSILVQELAKSGMLEKTSVIVLGDHGQSDYGWHPFEIKDSSITTAVLFGAGIKKGITVDYAELIDIVPTACLLMNAAAPKTSLGRPIVEALKSFNGEIPVRRHEIENLLDQLDIYRETGNLISQKIEKTNDSFPGKSAYYRMSAREISENFYDMDRFTEWPRFETIAELLSNNEKTLEKLKELADTIGNYKGK